MTYARCYPPRLKHGLVRGEGWTRQLTGGCRIPAFVGGENVSNDFQSPFERADRGSRAGANPNELRDWSAVLGNDNAFVTHAVQ